MATQAILSIVFLFTFFHAEEALLHDVDVTQPGCGTTRLCIMNVLGCDPIMGADCVFSSLELNNGKLHFRMNLGYGTLQLNVGARTYNYQCGYMARPSIAFTMFGEVLLEDRYPLAGATMSPKIPYDQIAECQFDVPPSLNITHGSVQLNSQTNEELVLTSFGTLLSQNYIGIATTASPATTTMKAFATYIPGSSGGKFGGTATTAMKAFSASLINNTGCGSTKLCISKQFNCNPEKPNCVFASVKYKNQNFHWELSAASTGYVALKLSKQSNIMFICGNSTSKNKFFLKTGKNTRNSLTPLTLAVTNVKSAVKKLSGKNLVQCTFNININSLGIDSQNINAISLAIYNGTIVKDQLGLPNALTETEIPIDLTNPCFPLKCNIQGDAASKPFTNL